MTCIPVVNCLAGMLKIANGKQSAYKLGLHRTKISQIINDYLYLLFSLLFILCFIPLHISISFR